LEENKKEEVVIKTIYPDHIRDLFVGGATGGITPGKQFHMAFFSERPQTASLQRFSLNEAGIIKERIEQAKDADVVRAIQTSIVMDISVAKSVYVWMKKVIDDFEENAAKLMSKIEEDEKKGENNGPEIDSV